jgi:hypothetical protein
MHACLALVLSDGNRNDSSDRMSRRGTDTRAKTKGPGVLRTTVREDIFTLIIAVRLQVGEFVPVTREPARLDCGLCAGWAPGPCHE